MREWLTLYTVPQSRVLYPQTPWPQWCSLDLCFSSLLPRREDSSRPFPQPWCSEEDREQYYIQLYPPPTELWLWGFLMNCLENKLLCASAQLLSQLMFGTEGGPISLHVIWLETFQEGWIAGTDMYRFFFKYLLLKHGRNKRGSTLFWSLPQRPELPVSIITPLSKGAAALGQNVLWKVWKVHWP